MKKKVYFLAEVLCFLLAFTALTGCSGEEILQEVPKEFGLMREEEDTKENDTRIVLLEDILADPGEEESGECFLAEEAGSYAFDSLSAPEQIWYRDMEKLLGSFGGKVELDGAVLDEMEKADADETVDKVFRCVLNDHPEIFYVDGYSCLKYMRGQRIVTLEFSGTYTMDLETALVYREEIEAAAGEILSGIDGDASDYDKVKYVYEAVIRGTDYELDAPENQNIYSVFVNHRSVCQGYAKATQYLLNRLGVESTLVLGTVDTGEGHAWNLVKVEGDYYYVDTTWGDVSYRPEEEENGIGGVDVGEKEAGGELCLPEINYDYLNVATEELFRTHSVGGVVPMPVCTASSANYYQREGAYFTSYDREQIEALFQRAEERGQINVSIKCSDPECYQDIFDMLVEQQEIFDFMGKTDGCIAYARNEKQCSLTFWVTNE